MPQYPSSNPWGGAGGWLRDAIEEGARKTSRFGTRAYPGMQAPFQDVPESGSPALPPEAEAFGKFLFDPTRDIYGSSTAVESKSAPEVAPMRRQIMDEDPVGAERPSGGSRVDVTIDGKTYSYGGGQRGGANGPAPVLDAQLNETSHSGATSGGFGGELRRMGRGPLEIASTGGAGELGAETGASGMVKLSKDSTTPMAEQLREEEFQRGLAEIQHANRMALEKKLAEDPLYLERERSKIKTIENASLYDAQEKATTRSVMQAQKMKALQGLERDAAEYENAIRDKYAKDPKALEDALALGMQRYQERKRALESQYGAT